MKATKEELIDLYYDQKLSLSKIAIRYGVCAQTILNWMHGYGIQRRSLSQSWHNKTDDEKHLDKMHQGSRECVGAARWNWRPNGSKRLETTGGSVGYISVKHNGEWVLEYRLVMEQHLGRKLQAGEEIHHKNQDKTDNRSENLELFAGHSAHLLAFNHRTGDENDPTELSDA